MILTCADKINQLSPSHIKTVDYDRGFHFFYGSGNYSGETANSLITLGFILETIGIESIRYHIGRRDFQNWISTTLGDDVLAGRIDIIKTDISDVDLRDKIIEVLNRRLQELSSSVEAS